MIIAGGMEAKVVLYPIGAGSDAEHRLTNWAVMVKVGEEGTPPPRREDWSRPGRLDELMPHVGPLPHRRGRRAGADRGHRGVLGVPGV